MCTNCKQDTYSEIYEAKAMADCVSCSGTKTTGANNTGNINISACGCKKDIYYQDQNDCFACPRGSICNRPAFNFDQDGVVIQEVYPTAGHWRSKDTDAYFSPCAKSLVGQGNAEDMAKARCCPLNSTTNISPFVIFSFVKQFHISIRQHIPLLHTAPPNYRATSTSGRHSNHH